MYQKKIEVNCKKVSRISHKLKDFVMERKLKCIKKCISNMGHTFKRGEEYEIIRIFKHALMLKHGKSNVTVGEKELKENFIII